MMDDLTDFFAQQVGLKAVVEPVDLFDSPVREDGSQKWVDFATTFWHVDCVRNMSLAAFTERYHKWCKRHRCV